MGGSRSQIANITITDEELILNLCLALVSQEPELIGAWMDLLSQRLQTLSVDDAKKLINLKTNAGYSAIYYAVTMGNADIFHELVDNGADLTTRYDNDLTLRDIMLRKITKNVGNDPYHDILAYLFEKGIGYDPESLKKFKDLKHNAQSWLINPLQQKGYQKSEGFCFGVANMGAQAFLLEERDEQGNLVHLNNFANRVNRLYESRNIFDEIEQSKHKRILLINLAKKDEQIEIEKICDKYLNDMDKKNLEMEPFFDGVEVYQQLFQHEDMMLEKRDWFSAMKLVPNLALEEKGGAVIVDRFSGNYDKLEDLKALFFRIEEIAKKKQHKSPIVLVLSANEHAITIGYDPVKQTWRNIDANCPGKMKDTNTTDRVAQNVQKQLQTSFNAKDLNLTVNILSTAANAENTRKNIITLLHNSKEWKNKHKHKFFALDKEDIMLIAGILLLGSGLIAASILTGGILPAAMTTVMLVSGGIIAAMGFIFGVASVGRSKLEPESDNIAKHLKTSVEDYKNKQKEKKKQSPQPSTNKIFGDLTITDSDVEEKKVTSQRSAEKNRAGETIIQMNPVHDKKHHTRPSRGR